MACRHGKRVLDVRERGDPHHEISQVRFGQLTPPKVSLSHVLRDRLFPQRCQPVVKVMADSQTVLA